MESSLGTSRVVQFSRLGRIYKVAARGLNSLLISGNAHRSLCVFISTAVMVASDVYQANLAAVALAFALFSFIVATVQAHGQYFLAASCYRRRRAVTCRPLA